MLEKELLRLVTKASKYNHWQCVLNVFSNNLGSKITLC